MHNTFTLSHMMSVFYYVLYTNQTIELVASDCILKFYHNINLIVWVTGVLYYTTTFSVAFVSEIAKFSIQI